jgi:DNA-binding CsgD family transcriptional regulator
MAAGSARHGGGMETGRLSVSTERGVFVARKAELAALDELSGKPVLIVVRGDGGTGKTALLDAARRAGKAQGIDTIRIRFGAESPRWDLFGVGAVVTAFREDFNQIGNSRVAAAMTSADRLCRPEAYRSAHARSRLLSELERLFGCLGNGTGRANVLIDDVHLAPDPALTVAAAYRAGCTVVAACREDGVIAEPTVLSALADRVLDLGPLAESEIDEMLAGATRGVPLDAAVAPALSAALGSLAGNPGAVLGTFNELCRAGRVVHVQDHLCLADPDRPVALPAEHHLVRFVARFGDVGTYLLSVITDAARFQLDDLRSFAAAIGEDTDTCGRVLDQLVAAGALECDKRGVLSAPCLALAAAVREHRDPAELPGVHRAIAEQLLRCDTAPSEPAVLAVHIALAGASLPVDPALVGLLVVEAADVFARDPLLAARWYRGALRHCEPGSVNHAQILTELRRLLMRIGHYRCLGEVVAEAVKVGFADRQRNELAASAALAAICTGVPIPAPVYAALARDTESRAPLEFCTKWFTSSEPAQARELTTAFAALSGEHTPAEDVELACDWHDASKMFEFALGPEFGEPVTGPLTMYARIRKSYLSGEWTEIPSYARALELAGPTHPAIHPSARLLTAEVLSCQGDGRRAAQWLELAGADCPYPAAYAWVQIGIVARTGEEDRARALGWAAYERITGDSHQLGLPWLLVRLGYLELRAGRTDELLRLCAEVKRWHARLGGVQLWVAELMLRGMAERDHAAAVTAVEIMRGQGAVLGLSCACVIVALLSDEQRPWFHEAYDIAKRLGDDWMRLSVKAFMVSSGVPLPRYRAGREELSTVEKSIIALIQRGLTNRQIAAAVQVSEKTIENHLTRLFVKTGCRSRLDLATASLEGRLMLAGYDRTASA